MLSTPADSGRVPSRKKRLRYWLSIWDVCSSVAPRRDLAIPRIFESIVSWRLSSRLFLRPYSPRRWSSASSCSLRHGWRGVSYVFLGFLGSPKYYSFFSSFFPLAAARAASMRTFFLTPTAFPERPVVLVRWPLTFNPRECRIPFQLLISFIRSISALFLRARSGPTRCISRPLSISFLRLNNREGIPCFAGSLMISSSLATSVSDKLPILASGLIRATLTTAWAKFGPTPRILLSPNGTFLVPSTSAPRTRRMSLNSLDIALTRGRGSLPNRLI